MSLKTRTRKRFVLTGATGLLGSNLLFEIIKQHLNDLDAVEIIILGRGKDDLDIEQRIRDLILKEGVSYLNTSAETVRKKEGLFEKTLRCMHLDLDQGDLGLTPTDYDYLKSEKIDIVFHVAALTDFRSTEAAVTSLRRTNVRGTEQVLKLVSGLNIGQFCYVGSAYSCGKKEGSINPDFINLKQDFRNPYEATKLEAEMMVRIFSKETGVPCKYFRASTICGRLIENEIGEITKFDVFYAWAAFFLRAKLKQVKELEGIYDQPMSMEVRILYNVSSGLNMVPADYAAKVMYLVATRQDDGGSYHLVNEKETLHGEYIPLMYETLNIQGLTHVDRVPEKTNKLEGLYYKTVGKIYTPYITSEPMLFNVDNIKQTLNEADLSCPEVDMKNFRTLMAYARKKNFGIQSSRPKIHVMKGS